MLTEYLDPKKIIIASHFDDYDALLRKLLEQASDIDVDRAIELIKQRDSLMTTALGKGVALPRIVVPERSTTEILIAVLERGLSLNGFDVTPVRLVMLFLCSKTDDYPSLLGQSIRLCTDDNFRANALKCTQPEQLIDLIKEWESE